MKTIVGIFPSVRAAQRAAEKASAVGIPQKYISALSPGASEESLEKVATTDTESEGMGKTLGGVVGGALGTAGGLTLGAAAASLFVPGVGPIIATGLVGAAVLGLGGAVAGVAAGEALEEGMASGLPKDDLFLYEDALRHGRSVVIALTDSDKQHDEAVKAFHESGAEGIDAARETWWLGLRDDEKAHYEAPGTESAGAERRYRRGFEAALRLDWRGKPYTSVKDRLRDCYGPDCEDQPFQRGYERGQAHQEKLEAQAKTGAATTAPGRRESARGKA